MCAKIAILSDDLVNKIAAGEVIENPASVVKELVENSLDAGATVITIAIEAGGRSLIRITDNGVGMERDDAELAFERHATSKLGNIDDIHTLDTMGFRGEAIPSIASISHFTLRTRYHEASEGTLIIVGGGVRREAATTPSPTGTTIEVKDLFFNVPARKKFQKSPAQDFQEILKTVTKLALAYPHVQFSLHHNRKEVLSAPQTRGTSLQEQLGERVEHILGESFFHSCLPFAVEKEGYIFTGLIGSPEYHRPNRTGQHLLLNRRAIQSPPIAYAIRDGYGTTLPQQRYPIFVVHGTLPGNRIDVNVHPQKKEVRLRHEPLVRELVREGVERALQRKSVPISSPVGAAPTFSAPPTDLPPPPPPSLPEKHPLPWEAKKWEPPPIHREQERSLPLPIPPKVVALSPPFILVEAFSLDLPEGFPPIDTGWVVVHQRHAHERILYEEWIQNDTAVESQNLLLPETFSLSPTDASLLRQALPLFTELGFTLREKETWEVTAIPSSWRGGAVVPFIQDCLHRWEEEGYPSLTRKEQREKIAVLACQRALGRQDTLSIREAEQLVQRLLSRQTPLFSPRGKKTMIPFSQEFLEKKFL